MASEDAPLIIHLRDRNAALVDAWRQHFAPHSSVKPSHGDIFGIAADAIVSPANSFGSMDGGIDAVYLERFGGGVQARLQAVLRDEHHGELPVGQAVVVETSNSEIEDRCWPSLSPREILSLHHELTAELTGQA